MKRNCIRCGKEFEAKHPSRKYCPGSCKQYAYYERKGMTFGNAVNDAGEEKVAEETESELNETAIEIPAKEEINPVNEIPVKDEQSSITPAIQEKNPGVLPEIEKPEKKSAPESQKQNPEPTITLSMKQLEELLKKVAVPQQPQQEKVIVIEKQVPVQTAVKEVKEEIKPLPVTPQPSPQLQEQKQEPPPEKISEQKSASIFTKENYPNWYYSQWENVNYVNERVKSHFKKLTEFTKRTVDISMVKYISEQMIELVDSLNFRLLPSDYPLANFIKEMTGRINKYVRYLEEEDFKKVKIRIAEDTLAEMKSVIARIGTTAPDVEHSTPKAGNTTGRKYNSYERRAKMREYGIIPKHS
ncbi:MAG: hypothetical protein HYU69_00340 [Bacteroidetes bacterium]|nr:hypothetical protein [Bacteroidota bacterium]